MSKNVLLSALQMAEPQMSREKTLFEKYPWAAGDTGPVEGPSVQVNTSPMFTPPTAPEGSGSILDPNSGGASLDSTDIALQDGLDPITGKNYAGSVRPKVQSFSDADQKRLIGNVMQQGLKVTPEMAILGGGMARDKSMLSDKNFEKPTAIDMQREQSGVAKAGQDANATRHKAVDSTQLLEAVGMVEKLPAVTGQQETIEKQETALKKLLEVEKNIPLWSKIDMTMSLAFMDELYGTKLAASYKPYSPPEAAIQKLNANILAEKGKLAAQRERMVGDLMKDKDTDARSSSIQGTREVTELPPGTMNAKIASANRPSGMGGGMNDYQAGRLGLGRDAFELAKVKADWAREQYLKQDDDNERDRAVKNLKNVDYLLKPAQSKRILNNLGIVRSIGAAMKAKYGHIPDTGMESSVAMFGDKAASLWQGARDTYKLSPLGSKRDKEFLTDQTQFNQAKGDVQAQIIQYYSGAAATDKEADRLLKILAGRTPVTQEAYMGAIESFERNFADDLRLRWALVTSNPDLKTVVDLVSPGDMAGLNRILNASRGDIKSNVQGGAQRAPQPSNPSTSYSDADIDRMLE